MLAGQRGEADGGGMVPPGAIHGQWIGEGDGVEFWWDLARHGLHLEKQFMANTFGLAVLTRLLATLRPLKVGKIRIWRLAICFVGAGAKTQAEGP